MRVKVIKQWGRYRLGSVHEFNASEARALKALGYVEDAPQGEVKDHHYVEKEVKKSKKRTYKRKDLQAED